MSDDSSSEGNLTDTQSEASHVNNDPSTIQKEEDLSDYTSSEPEQVNIAEIEEKTDGNRTIAELEREVDTLKNELKLYKEPFSLGSFNFTVCSAQVAKLHVTQNLHVNSHTLYKVLKQSKNGLKSSFVFRRYSDFSLLADLLRKKYDTSLIPKEPPKRKLNKNELFVKFRLVHLNAFLNAIIDNSTFYHDSIVSDFLQLPSEEWAQVLEKEQQNLTQEDFKEQAKEYLISRVTSLNVLGYNTNQIHHSSLLNSFILNFERDNTFTYLDGSTETKKEINLKDIFQIITDQFKTFITEYIQLFNLHYKLDQKIILLGMNYGGTDMILGPTIFTTLQHFTKSLLLESKLMKKFILDISGIEIDRKNFETNESFAKTLVGNCYSDLCIASGMKRFLESNLSKKDHSEETVEEAQRQLSWGIVSLEKNISPTAFKAFASNMASFHESKVNIFESLLTQLDNIPD